MKDLDMYWYNSIAKPPTKLKELIHGKIDPTPDYEKAGVYLIQFSIEHQKSEY